MKRFLLVFTVLSFIGCSNNPSPESGAVIGAVAGGTGGAIVGNDLGNTGAGAAIGAASGAAVGAVVASQTDDKQKVIDVQQDIIHGQQEQMYRQGKELQDIKRQEYWDEKLKKYGN